jgi:hypothetical protein
MTLPRAPEAPAHRPFAALAYGATVVVATPLGTWMLAGLHWGWGAADAETGWLHAHLQIFGFFGVLILGVAQHLLPRFAGRPVALGRARVWLLAGVAAALALRVGGWLGGRPAPAAGASAIEALVFGGFALWVWRTLAAPALVAARRQLVGSTLWLAGACLLEAVARLVGLGGADGRPSAGWIAAAQALGLYGGVLGWIVGVVIRAGPMFVAGWAVPPGLARRAPLVIAAGVLLAAAGALAGGRAGGALARGGEALALGTAVLVPVAGGLLGRRRSGQLPLHGRQGPERGLFRFAWACAALGTVALAGAGGLAAIDVPPSLLDDAARHLVTLGFLTALALAMTFRLLPVLEGRPLRCPGAPRVATWTLAGAVVLRTAEVAADYGWEPVLRAVPLSGGLAWAALAGAAASVVAAGRAPAPPR